MSVSISLRLPDEVATQLENIATIIDRSKSFLIKKAIERYLEEYVDYQIALDRLNDKDDKIISSKEMRKQLASKD
jgi:predicted DNA-binding protein